MKNIVVLGSTGSIGTSSLEVISKLGKGYKVLGLSTYGKEALILQQLKKFKPKYVSVLPKATHDKIKNKIPAGTKLLSPTLKGLNFLSSLKPADLIINGLVGSVGFEPLISSIKAGKTIALANKEPIVMAGELIMKLAKKYNAKILPVDSEPSAVFQCLDGICPSTYHNTSKLVEKFFLTASGGPFFNYKGNLSKVSPAQALKHPRWKMGPKITIDSSTLMNKGFELIELMHLFSIPMDKIQIVIHPQSVVHGAVEYKDGSILAKMSLPDMKLPIQYAITYPEKCKSPVKKLDLFELGKLEFYRPNLNKFPCLNLALQCAKKGGSYPVVLNASNEVAVQKFLAGEIKFTDISKLIEKVLNKNPYKSARNLNLKKVQEIHNWATKHSREKI
ncbi:MAG: 1-deoxy-D-xylulose-5-phosphate reductoisomerase [Elusimicrobiaceae bacterium]|jgi:1-deoxy-D-xylulose-5-phosphate reductoisomerase|nr:1-deoxy-D-xylulose-5-phosphate reductoisomerase [Elusimicrobiaceae bacterium]MBT3955400.1 1-deoxy-D-xylulose-5-phosphate reductoisomerase [Elusimicrobiaceae bacterium]MBT4007677.1 1-deoxy-D-xylulose-5-phosphate reductoisomerase [Elusimicrobiaceae bacterium]MBT4402313.1 1-deoxy-D-xylulose-5-phosphate reductoisomerase [Elusimicrobiaceae bacterium]MBT4439546.1 1-deoxy-D-xylulose-5-phosphate reductoisomerase [Elusimicrobiaceae bacterium]